jgi:hypothetical protein
MGSDGGPSSFLSSPTGAVKFLCSISSQAWAGACCQPHA